MKSKELIKLIPCFYLPLVIFLLHTLILVPFGIYKLFNWMDMPMHFLGGCAIAYSFILVLRKVKEKVIINDRFFEILIIISLVGLSAILWEFYEFIMDIVLLTPINSLKDTLCDFLFGLVGALMVTKFVRIKK